MLLKEVIESLIWLSPTAQVLVLVGLFLLVLTLMLIIAFSPSGGRRLSDFLSRCGWTRRKSVRRRPSSRRAA